MKKLIRNYSSLLTLTVFFIFNSIGCEKFGNNTQMPFLRYGY